MTPDLSVVLSVDHGLVQLYPFPTSGVLCKHQDIALPFPSYSRHLSG